jgi:4-hydroxyphenylpyruvate dioxygenase-like putative hemolysin
MTSLVQIKAGLGALATALEAHDAWARANNAEAKEQFEKSVAEHHRKQKEWRKAAQSIGGLLLKLHERLDGVMQAIADLREKMGHSFAAQAGQIARVEFLLREVLTKPRPPAKRRKRGK